MKTKPLSLLLVLSTFILIQCSKEEKPDVDIDAPRVSAPLVDDVSNFGNGQDLYISFNKVSNEALISEYRVMVVKQPNANFSLEEALAVSNTDYITLLPDGQNKALNLEANSTDTGGDLIVPLTQYRIYVLSIADGINAQNHKLSSPSSIISLEETSIKITYIGNDGVYIEDGSKSVIIDALPGSLTGWNPIAPGIQNDIENGRDPFSGISVAMVTHNHGDHVSISSVNNFLARNNTSKVIAPPDITGSISSNSQVIDLSLLQGEFEDVVVDGIKIKVMHMMHFDAFGNDFSTVVNYGFLVELGGKKILHLGDFKYSKENLEPFNLNLENIDVALIPGLSPFLNESSKNVIENNINPDHIIVLHLQSSTSSFEVLNIYPDAEVFTSSLQHVRY